MEHFVAGTAARCAGTLVGVHHNTAGLIIFKGLES